MGRNAKRAATSTKEAFLGEVEKQVPEYGMARQTFAGLDHLEGKPVWATADGRIVFAATVELEDAESGGTVTYQIVGDDEADIKAGKISVSSPIARALIGKYAGDAVDVQAPGGVRQYEVLDVRYV